MVRINFEQILDTDSVNICFVRKYGPAGDSKYIFYTSDITTEVASKLRTWIKSKVGGFNNRDLGTHNFNSYQTPKYLDLSSVDLWNNKYLSPIVDLDAEKMYGDITKIPTQNVIAFIVWARRVGTMTGFIRHLTPAHIMKTSSRYRLFGEEGVLSILEEDKGIKIDNKADLLFQIHNNEHHGIILDVYNFNKFMDMTAQRKRASLEVIDRIEVLQGHPDLVEVKTCVESDGTLQLMLLNPTVSELMNLYGIEHYTDVKTKLGAGIAYEIVNGELIFPPANKKQAIRDFINTISKISYCLDKNTLIEGQHEKILRR